MKTFIHKKLLLWLFLSLPFLNLQAQICDFNIQNINCGFHWTTIVNLPDANCTTWIMDYGDGNFDTGTISSGPQTSILLSGTHIYANSGINSIKLSFVCDTRINGCTATVEIDCHIYDECPLEQNVTSNCEEFCFDVYSSGGCDKYNVSFGPCGAAAWEGMSFDNLAPGWNTLCFPQDDPGLYGYVIKYTNCEGQVYFCNDNPCVFVGNVAETCAGMGDVTMTCDEICFDIPYTLTPCYVPRITLTGPNGVPQIYNFSELSGCENSVCIPVDGSQNYQYTFELYGCQEELPRLSCSGQADAVDCGDCDLPRPNLELCCYDTFICVCEDGAWSTQYHFDWGDYSSGTGQCAPLTDMPTPADPITIVATPYDPAHADCQWTFVFEGCGEPGFGDGRNGNEEAVISEKSEIQLFPNPAQEYIQVVLDTENRHDFQLFNAQGQLMQSGTITKSKSIGLENMPAGVYFIKISDVEKSEISTLRFSKY